MTLPLRRNTSRIPRLRNSATVRTISANLQRWQGNAAYLYMRRIVSNVGTSPSALRLRHGRTALLLASCLRVQSGMRLVTSASFLIVLKVTSSTKPSRGFRNRPLRWLSTTDGRTSTATFLTCGYIYRCMTRWSGATQSNAKLNRWKPLRGRQLSSSLIRTRLSSQLG